MFVENKWNESQLFSLSGYKEIEELLAANGASSDCNDVPSIENN